MENWKRNLYVIWIAEFLALAGFSTSMPIIPFFLQDLGVTDPVRLKYLVGLSNSVGSITLAIFAPIWGRLADSYGRKPMFLRALIGGMILYFLMGFSRTPGQLILYRALQGVVTGTVAAATVLVASTVPKEEAGFGLGLLQTAVFMGSSIGPLLGGTISDFYGHRTAFFSTAAILLVSAFLVFRFVSDNFVPPPKDSVRRKFSLKSIIPDFSPLRESRELLILVLAVAIVQISNSVVTPILPLFIQDMTPENTLVGSMTGLVLGAGALAAALAAAGIGKVSFRFGYRRSLLFCMIGAACFAVPQGLSATPIQLLLFRILGGVFLGGTMPSINAMIALRTDTKRQGSIYGLTSAVGSTGMAIGPVIGAAVSAAFGFSWAFFSMTVLLLAGTSFILFMTKTLQKKQS